MPADHESVSRRSIGARRNPETETAILDAAAELLAADGPAALTMDAVAKKARAGKATLYRWWPTRGALLVAVYERIKGDHPHDDTGTLEGDLAAFYDHVFGFWRQGAGRVFAHIIAEAQSDRGVGEALTRYRTERVHALEPIVERALARGEIPQGTDQHAFCETLVAVLWYHLLIDGIDRPGAEVARGLVSAWRAA